MKKIVTVLAYLYFGIHFINGQEIIPLDTLNWDIEAESYVLEKFKGKDAIYLKGGSIKLKNKTFLNGTIEYDIHLRKTRAFPGIYFRSNGSNAEQFYIRPHQSGNPDANQALPQTHGISAWQLYHGDKYSFPYEYRYDDWTHVKLVVHDNRAQVYLDHSEKPNLSWQLFHDPKSGGISLTGGNAQALHLANISIDQENHQIKDFKPVERKPIDGLIRQWHISDKFEERLLKAPGKLSSLIQERKWGEKIAIEEGTAANISRIVERYDNTPNNTVFAKVEIIATKDGPELFEFGYSDRVVVILNGEPIYQGTNRFQSRDYRYLGTIGLFDAVYLPLKKGKNTLLLAVSEDFGGWLVTGRFPSNTKLTIN